MAIINGVRVERAIGDAPRDAHLFDTPQSNWAQTVYNQFLGPMRSTYPAAFANATPIILKAVQWEAMYVNQSITPSQAQAENPNWSNYIWNRSGSPGGGAVYDGLTAALNSSLISNGSGVAKIAIIMGITSTGGPFNLPNFIKARSDWHWIDDGNVNGAQAEQLRLDNTQAMNHVRWMLKAFLLKFGGNLGVHSIQLAEYYYGSNAARPSNLNESLGLANMASLWSYVVAQAPRDASGNRVLLLQKLPRLDDNTPLQTLLNSGIGMSMSDTDITFPVSNQIMTGLARQMYDAGRIVMKNNDSRYSRENDGAGRNQSWANCPTNPWGYTGGSRAATPQHLMWYSGEVGPSPCHIFCMARSWDPNPGPQTLANYENAIATIATNSTWGPSPALLEASSITVNGTPTIIGSLSPGNTLTYAHNLSSPDGAVVVTGQQWIRGVLPTRNPVWTGPSFNLTSEHIGETFEIGVDFTVGGVPQTRKLSVQYGPVTSSSVPLALNSIGDKQVLENNLLQFTVSANDPTATLSITNQPAGSAFTAGTGRFLWTPTTDGNYSVTFTATKGGETASETIVIMVSEYTSTTDVVWQKPIKIGHLVSRIMYQPNGDKFGFGAGGLIIFQTNAGSTWSILNQDVSGEWGQPHVMDDGTRYIMYSSNGTQVRVQVWTY